MTAPQNIAIGGVRCVSARAVFRWTGPWFVDLDVDPDGDITASAVPTGQQTITIGDLITLVGTVDPKASGRFASTIRIRVVAGAGGWGQAVPAQDFQQSSGVSSVAVENQTAGLIGETVNDPQPVSLGLRWDRMAGPASSIFTNPARAWYVDTTGTTQVSGWPAATPDPTVEVLDFDPAQQRATLSADALVLPGTVLTDTSSTPRWDGPLTVRDVEMSWSKEGTRATVWFSSVAVPRLLAAFQTLIERFGAIQVLKRWVYTIVEQTGATLTLQPVQNPDGSASEAPPLANVVVWPGMSGLSATYKLSSTCAVVFLAPGFQSAIVVHFDGSLPTQSQLDASAEVDIGPSAATVKIGNTTGSVDIAGGGPGAARLGDTVLAYMPSPCPISGVINGTEPFVGTIEIPGPMIGSIQTSSNRVNVGS